MEDIRLKLKAKDEEKEKKKINNEWERIEEIKIVKEREIEIIECIGKKKRKI